MIILVMSTSHRNILGSNGVFLLRNELPGEKVERRDEID
jgi:hypothetical protein